MTDTSSAPRLVAPRELRSMVGGLSESSIRRLMDVGRFPRPIVLSVNRHGRPARVAWVEAEVRAWIAGRIEAARATDPKAAA